MPDAMIIDDLPNVVVDEEGFEVARFRYEKDARGFVSDNYLHGSGDYHLLADDKGGDDASDR